MELVCVNKEGGLSGVGSGGILVNAGDRYKLIPGNVTVENNYIHDVSRWDRCYNPGRVFQEISLKIQL
jgi:ABC-type uncharacterized transport system ATPase component